MPHAIAVDESTARAFGDSEHPAVNVGRHTAQHLLRWSAKSRGPVLADQLLIRAESPRGHDHGVCLELEFTNRQTRARSTSVHRAWFEDGALHAIDGPAAQRKRVDAMPELDGDEAIGRRLANAPLKGRHDGRARPPRYVEARHGIPRAARYGATSLRPADDREEVHTLRAQPRPILAGGEGNVSLGPLAGPGVFGPIETGRDPPALFRPPLPGAHAPPALVPAGGEKKAAR